MKTEVSNSNQQKDNKDKLKKKFTHARPEFRKDMTLEEEAEIINQMSEAMVDAIFGKDFGREAKKGNDKEES